MKAKLIKDSDGYWLDISDDGITKRPLTDFGQLSIKNCEAIANGYDLDELADEHCNKLYHEGNINWDRYRVHFKLGFQKAIEILSDKKFTENDIVDAYMAGHIRGMSTDMGEDNIHPICSEYLNSLQQTEWDVEVELVCPHPLNTYVCGMQYGCDGDGCNHPNQIPYLDKDGNLILKRI